ncbi:hypothetical protein Tco_0663694, partial [Tanacetum coccineum]
MLLASTSAFLHDSAFVTFSTSCVSRDVKFKENETWDWKDYMSEHTDNE